jgi:hypothetical protein
MEQENREVPAGTVLQVFQAGYMIEDRCLKPALVVVSRGGPKMSRPAAAQEEGAGTDSARSADTGAPGGGGSSAAQDTDPGGAGTT